MAKKNRLKRAAERIGTAVGRAERRARNITKAARVGREELRRFTKKLDALARDLKKSSNRIKESLR